MNWLERLNANPQNSPIANAANVLHWGYSQHLIDNVPHRHTYFELCLVGDHGAGIFTVGEERLPIAPGDLFLARPGVIHQIQNTSEPFMELFWVAFDVQKDLRNDEVGTLWQAFTQSQSVLIHDEGPLLALWKALRAVSSGDEIAGKSAQLQALQKAILLALAGLGAGNQVPATLPPTSEKHATARLATRYIHDNLCRKITIKEIAAYVHLSSRQLQRLFSAFAGTSILDYLETARIDRARHLLSGTNHPIKAIAASVGYEDVHYFTRVFTRRCKVAPGEFRRSQSAPVRKIQKNGGLV